MQKNTKKIALMGIGLAISMILSYIEFLLPPIFSAVPGIKLGLANIIIIFLLYRVSFSAAAAVSLLRVCLSSLLFGSILTFMYSLAGAALSLIVMCLVKRIGVFSEVGVSVSGAVSHNFGQIVVAMIILSTREIGYYMAVLAVSGTVAGVFVGIASALLLKYIKNL